MCLNVRSGVSPGVGSQPAACYRIDTLNASARRHRNAGLDICVRPASGRLPSVISAIFFLSGFASLIYQVSWQRLLTLHYGVGAVSVTLIVSVYMLGLGFGSLLGGRLAQRSEDPYALYAAVQGALGVAGLASLPCMVTLGAITASGNAAVSLAALFAFLCVPTMLMGITLPLVVTIVTRLTPDFLGSVSRLYFINTLGASCGAVLTGFVLVSLVGLDGCIVLAAAIDVLLAVVILLVRPPGRAGPAQPGECLPDEPADWRRLAYLLVFCSGFMAIGYEIVWYRVVGVLVKDSPYAFASVLAVCLLGIALGSRAIHQHMIRRPAASGRDLFFTLQFLIGVTVLLTFIGYYHLSRVPPVQWLTQLSFLADEHPSVALFLRSPGRRCFEDVYLLLDVFLWPVVFTLVPSMLMGASFPLIASVALSRRGREGTAVGTTYFLGVLGNVLGGLVTGMVLLPAVGSETTALAFGLMGLLFGLAPGVPPTGGVGSRPLPRQWRIAWVFLLVAASAALFPRNGALYRAMHVAPFAPNRVHVEEGLDAVVLTYEDGDRVRNFINGQGHGYRPGPVFQAEAFEGLAHAAGLRRVLVVGFGAGTIAEAALIPEGVERVTVVELSGSLIANLRKLPPLARTIDDPRVRLVTADGRRFLQRTNERFDAILMDPLRTTTAYSNNLHSREFFALAARHLAPGGILMVGGLDGTPVIPRTLLEEFRFVRSYPYFCLASKGPLVLNQVRLEGLLGALPEDQRESVRSLTTDTLEGEALVRATAAYPANQDWRPVSEYYLGLQVMAWLRTNAPR